MVTAPPAPLAYEALLDDEEFTLLVRSKASPYTLTSADKARLEAAIVRAQSDITNKKTLGDRAGERGVRSKLEAPKGYVCPGCGHRT
jgi:hypothetical protein